MEKQTWKKKWKIEEKEGGKVKKDAARNKIKEKEKKRRNELQTRKQN